MSPSRAQRYKLVAEFDLCNRKYYQIYRKAIIGFFKLLNNDAEFHLDYCAIEKVEESKNEPR